MTPATEIHSSEILMQNKTAKGMPMLMALLDDVVTEAEVLAPPAENN